MNSFRTHGNGCRQDLFHIQITFGRRSRSDADGFIRKQGMKAVPVCLRIDCD